MCVYKVVVVELLDYLLDIAELSELETGISPHSHLRTMCMYVTNKT
jgi:hypothetical protein